MFAQEERKKIDGELFGRMIVGGATNLQANMQEVNALNVFPIPDGDTGENMYLTIHGGLERLNACESEILSERAEAVAQGMLLGARGNSGVILSQLFYGFSEGLKGLENADLEQVGRALLEGVKHAYGAVAHPVEGTILTVAREAAENACGALTEDTTVEVFFLRYLDEMKKSLEKTPELLAVLKEAGVIDSGGAGLVYIAEGFCKAIGGEEAQSELATSVSGGVKDLDFSRFDADTVMTFGYCTELLLQLQNAKTSVEDFSVSELISFLETVGDSIVAFKTGSVVKIHVHTLTPWKVLAHCQEFGEFLTVKIENMTLQHNETVAPQKTEFKKPKRARRKFATVTVATGEGLQETFKEMGADFVIYGGQTNNPSAEDFIEAFEEVNADFVFVLPNNGNVILAANQAAQMYKDSDIRVIESKNVGQGYSALSMLDYGADDADEIVAQMYESMSDTVTGMVARSVRDTAMNGVGVQKDWYMGFTDHTMLVCQREKVDTALALAEALNAGDKEFVLIVYGATATGGEKEAFASRFAEQYPSVELYEIEGGQEVYDFLIIVE